ncbi:5'-3' exonuclease [Raineyella fluvialis]|uniref:5'-3' exonuclease n=1 Tax=Raineyella fluvialis TaxID=2662261 RepID=A0A5Q2FGG6_9ACTN|nr:5'-3' exonuclease H3TH domain-containing protein [Raineyella fluvialis]QGF24624.1 flap endonuclease [Raineyella fluvialis]
MATPHLLAVDTSYLFFRAFHGVPATLRSPTGEPVNAVRGTLDTLARLLEERHPTHLACAWDADWRPAWRVELMASYKAHRVAPDGRTEQIPDDLVPQIGVIRQVLEALGLPVLGATGAEADDVMGTLTVLFRGTGPVLLASGDRDFTQLVDDAAGVALLTPVGRTPGWREIHEAEVREAYGVDAAAYVDLAALRGDSSDGIPGVPGIGDRTAARLLARYGDLTGVRRAAADGAVEKGGLTARQAEGIEAAAGYLDVAPRVIRIKQDLDLGLGPDDLRLPRAVADPAGWERLVAEYGLASPASRLTQALGL